MKPALPLALALAMILPATAQAQAGLGRLFNAPQERQALDRQRARPIAAPAGATSAAPAAPVPAYPGDAAAAPAGPANPAAMAGLPPGTPPEVTAAMLAATAPGAPPSMPASAPPAMPPGPPPSSPGTADAGGAAPDAVTPSQLTMNGVLRTSNGRSTVWLNNVPQGGTANKFRNGNRQALTVTLPSGKRVVLQPGQRYDLVDGRVKDISEP